MNWVTVDRPGYFGTNRDEIELSWNEKHPFSKPHRTDNSNFH